MRRFSNAFGGIAFRLGAAMMLAALMSTFLIIATVFLTVEVRVRTSRPEMIEVRGFFDRIAQLCVSQPDLMGECPRFITDVLNATSRNDSSAAARPLEPASSRGEHGGLSDIIDPRPWIVPTLVLSMVLAAALALATALLVGRRVAQPIQAVSLAAQAVAGGQLSARVAVSNRASSGDETSQLALSFNRMAQSLERNELERRQLIADIAHELRTPLAVMLARLEALEDGVFALDQSEITRLQVQTRFLARLVEDLRVLSLAEAGRLSLETRRVDLRLLTLEIASGFQAKAAQEHKTIRVTTQAAFVNADPDRLRQVLTNLLENALKYSSTEVKISLKVDTPAEALIVIADDGDGLPPSDLTRVFDRFYRSDESRNRTSGGSGLGLSIVKAIIGLHRGRVSARNLEPRGAEFTVALPVSA